ncbi:diaminopimelate epimerase [Halorarum salinum]|uniref:Diaminopimelate epimerase n=1 Tax=Halorarum salinum TaxID=2743089 RepID=A0A7D5QER5_9EURY|nr:diaminopimelate epimerase [Halobaculum salinum]QLG62961.1 diaminopimelate epimerase [Halobaculum salinum]
MTRVGFTKYHGTGNDFLVVDAEEPVPDRAAFAVARCDRETGVDAGARRGADGVLFLGLDAGAADAPGRDGDGRPDDPVRVRMTLVQPDGSVAEMCGNGARCVASWAADRTGASEFVIGTPAGDRRAVVGDDGVEVEMGRPSFAPADVPLAGGGPLVGRSVEGLTVTAVNTGVPHAVAFVDDLDAVDLASVAPPVRHADAFPEGANVTLAEPVAADEADAGGARAAEFRQRTFERGVEDETRACGTGAVAVLAAARRTGRTDRESATVSPPGGELRVTVPADGSATLAGPTEREAEGTLEAEP